MHARMVRLSRFVHFLDIDKSSNIAMFNSLSMSMAVIDEEVVHMLKDGHLDLISRHELDLLIKHKILATEKDDDRDLEKARSFFEKKVIGTLCLMLTDACNLKCRYCFVEHRFPASHKFSMMSLETAKKGIDLFSSVLPESIKSGLEQPTINFYGGEATMNLETLSFSLDYINRLKERNKLPSNLLVSLNTNATLISEDIAVLLKKSGVSASISIDGPKDIHDSARLDTAGKGSYDDAIRGLAILKKAGVPVGISCAVDLHNLSSLEDIARWYNQKLSVKIFGFNILLEGGIKYPDFDYADYAEKVGDKLTRIFQICRGIGVREERTARLASAFAHGQIHYYDCGACGQQIVVDPTGMIGVCHSYTDTKERKYFVPFSDDVDPLSHPNWQEWRMRSPLNMEECLDCVALSLCGGGCPYNADSRHGSIWAIDKEYCPFAKKMTSFLVKDLANKLIAR